jgi:hypothetical protein
VVILFSGIVVIVTSWLFAGSSLIGHPLALRFSLSLSLSVVVSLWDCEDGSGRGVRCLEKRHRVDHSEDNYSPYLLTYRTINLLCSLKICRLHASVGHVSLPRFGGGVRVIRLELQDDYFVTTTLCLLLLTTNFFESSARYRLLSPRINHLEDAVLAQRPQCPDHRRIKVSRLIYLASNPQACPASSKRHQASTRRREALNRVSSRFI